MRITIFPGQNERAENALGSVWMRLVIFMFKVFVSRLESRNIYYGVCWFEENTEDSPEPSPAS